ncbi:MAG: DoxX family protein [Halioglobus sp.]
MFSWKYLGLTVVFLWFMGGGITHFTNPDFFVSIMPPYVGWHLEIVYISGALEILGAIGILIPRLRQWSGNALIALVICVTPANIHMWLHPELFPDVPAVFLSIRLLVQVLLLWCIWWSTRAAVKEATMA